MTMTSSPPMRTSPIAKTVSSGLNVRLASLYGSLIRSTSWTPSSNSTSRGSTLPLPTTPSTVREAPDDRCTSMPSSTRWAITCSTCASLARSFMTTTISMLLGDLLTVRSLSRAPTCSRDGTNLRQSSHSLSLHEIIRLGRLRFELGLDALDAPRFVHDAFVQADDGVLVQRAAELGVQLLDPRR